MQGLRFHTQTAESWENVVLPAANQKLDEITETETNRSDCKDGSNFTEGRLSKIYQI